VPSHDDRHLFEMLVLEGAQAGLSWSTILRKREGYRTAFAGFDPAAMAAYDETDVARLLADPGIVRNRLKVESAIANARAVLGSAGQTLVARLSGTSPDRRAANRNSRGDRDAGDEPQLSGAFRFVSPTVCYAFMSGPVNDHVVGCAAGEIWRRGGAGPLLRRLTPRRRPR
jgi:DNA-3-methyladenine glycosylase I